MLNIISNLQPRQDTPFDSSFEEATFSAVNCNSTASLSASSFSEEMRILADNSSKLDSVLALNNASRHASSTLPVVNPLAGPTQPAITATKLNPFASLAAPAKSVLRGNPLATVMNGHAAYDMFQNAPDGSISPAPPASHSSVGSSVATQQPESEALFQDFALSAFNEFKKDLSNSTANRRGGPFGVASKTMASSKAAEFGTGGKGAPINTGTAVGTHSSLNGARVIMANGTQFHEKVFFFSSLEGV